MGTRYSAFTYRASTSDESCAAAGAAQAAIERTRSSPAIRLGRTEHLEQRESWPRKRTVECGLPQTVRTVSLARLRLRRARNGPATRILASTIVVYHIRGPHWFPSGPASLPEFRLAPPWIAPRDIPSRGQVMFRTLSVHPLARLAAALLVLGSPAFAQRDGGQPDSLYTQQHYNKAEHMVPMRDGVK